MSEVGKTFCAPAMPEIRLLTLVRRRVAAALALLLPTLSYRRISSILYACFALPLLCFDSELAFVSLSLSLSLPLLLLL